MTATPKRRRPTTRFIPSTWVALTQRCDLKPGQIPQAADATELSWDWGGRVRNAPADDPRRPDTDWRAPRERGAESTATDDKKPLHEQGLSHVDLIGTYSNHRNRADLLKRTRRWLSEGRQARIQDPKVSVRAVPKVIVPRRVVDRLGEEAVRELVEARQAGAKLRELVERYEVSESSLKRLLRAAAKSD